MMFVCEKCGNEIDIKEPEPRLWDVICKACNTYMVVKIKKEEVNYRI
jgi:DNA-directed RNA polymerase subunit RPC12/RpoP